ncbi:MAG TPA: DUF4352 domain-containing protein [Bryobacteraceae bacterium]|nr:DUF4352 domain-containing protein [Bryobacteraceae bacterium]
MSKRPELFIILTVAVCFGFAGCGARRDNRLSYQMGERVAVGPLTYNVVETTWRSQLGDGFRLRFPQQRFLLVTVSVTNSGGKEISVPLLQLENQNNETFQELDNGEGVDNWFGILRNITPAETQLGRLIFDVPLTSYRLRLTDGGTPGSEKYAWVEIPLRMDTDSNTETPIVPSK